MKICTARPLVSNSDNYLQQHSFFDHELKEWHRRYQSADPVVVSKTEDAESLIIKAFNKGRRRDGYSAFRVYVMTVSISGELDRSEILSQCEYVKHNCDDPESSWWHASSGSDILGYGGVNLNAHVDPAYPVILDMDDE